MFGQVCCPSGKHLNDKSYQCDFMSKKGPIPKAIGVEPVSFFGFLDCNYISILN